MVAQPSMNQLINIYDQSSMSELNIKSKEVRMRSFICQSLIAFTALVSFVTMGITTVAAEQGDIEAGKKLYQQRCAVCHGPDGTANTDIAKNLEPKPRDHTDGKYMNNLSNDYLSKVIKEGGKAVGKSQVMPGQTDLSAPQIQDLIAFVRSLAVPPYRP